MSDQNNEARIAAQAQEYQQAEQYLRLEGDLEDRWILDDKRPWFKINQVDQQIGMTGEGIRALILRGLETDGAEGIPGGVMNSPQSGWQIPRRGLVVYMARRRRAMRERSTG